jgi:hypothetical protein
MYYENKGCEVTVFDIITDPNYYLNKSRYKRYVYDSNNNITTEELRNYEKANFNNDRLVYFQYLKAIVLKEVSWQIVKNKEDYGYEVSLVEIIDFINYLSKRKVFDLYVIGAEHYEWSKKYDDSNYLNCYQMERGYDHNGESDFMSLYDIAISLYSERINKHKSEYEPFGLIKKDVQKHHYEKLEEYCDYILESAPSTPVEIFRKQAFQFVLYCNLSSGRLSEMQCVSMLSSKFSMLSNLSFVTILIEYLIIKNQGKFTDIVRFIVDSTLSIYNPTDWKSIWLEPSHPTIVARDLVGTTGLGLYIPISLLSKYLRSAKNEQDFIYCLDHLNKVVSHLGLDCHYEIAETILFSRSMPNLVNIIHKNPIEYESLFSALSFFEAKGKKVFDNVYCIINIGCDTQIYWYQMLEKNFSRKFQLKILDIAVNVGNHKLAQYIFNGFGGSQQSKMKKSVQLFIESSLHLS